MVVVWYSAPCMFTHHPNSHVCVCVYVTLCVGPAAHHWEVKRWRGRRTGCWRGRWGRGAAQRRRWARCSADRWAGPPTPAGPSESHWLALQLEDCAFIQWFHSFNKSHRWSKGFKATQMFLFYPTDNASTENVLYWECTYSTEKDPIVLLANFYWNLKCTNIVLS